MHPGSHHPSGLYVITGLHVDHTELGNSPAHTESGI
jgi:hypothetical protein